MADASDSKSDEGDLVWVQVPSPASRKKKVGRDDLPFFLFMQEMDVRIKIFARFFAFKGMVGAL